MNCGNCGKKLDEHSNIDDDALKPKEGDISVCLYCGEVNQFINGKLELVDVKDLPKDTQQYLLKIERARQKTMT